MKWHYFTPIIGLYWSLNGYAKGKDDYIAVIASAIWSWGIPMVVFISLGIPFLYNLANG
jgi:hypothetical protein